MVQLNLDNILIAILCLTSIIALYKLLIVVLKAGKAAVLRDYFRTMVAAKPAVITNGVSNDECIIVGKFDYRMGCISLYDYRDFFTDSEFMPYREFFYYSSKHLKRYEFCIFYLYDDTIHITNLSNVSIRNKTITITEE